VLPVVIARHPRVFSVVQSVEVQLVAVERMGNPVMEHNLLGPYLATLEVVAGYYIDHRGANQHLRQGGFRTGYFEDP